MSKSFSIRNPGPTDLTWDEKNPTNYIYMSAATKTSEKKEKPEKKTARQNPKMAVSKKIY